MKGKTMDPVSLFSINEHLKSVKDDMLEKLDEIVDFESFREMITERLGYGYNLQGGCLLFDPVAMFKILILQNMYNLSDAKTEQMMRRYLPWMLFLGFEFGDAMPDQNTIRHFRNRLTETGALPLLEQAFDNQLEAHGLAVRAGRIVEGSLVRSPGQQLTKEEKEVM